MSQGEYNGYREHVKFIMFLEELRVSVNEESWGLVGSIRIQACRVI